MASGGPSRVGICSRPQLGRGRHCPGWVCLGLSWCADPAPTLWGGCGLQLLCSLGQARAVQALALLFKSIIAGDCFQSKWRPGACARYRSQLITSAGLLPSGPVRERPARQPPALATNPTEGVAAPGPSVAPLYACRASAASVDLSSKQSKHLGFCFLLV